MAAPDDCGRPRGAAPSAASVLVPAAVLLQPHRGDTDVLAAVGVAVRRGLRTAIGNERPVEREAPTEWTWRQRRAVAGQWASVVLLGVAAFGLLVMVVGAMGALDFYPRLLRKIGAVCLSMIGLFVWAFSLRFLAME